jgi:methyl-accepting chemotaxis protein
MGTESRKKRSLLINPSFQWHIIGYAGVMALLILAAVYGLLSFAFHEFVKVGLDAGLPADHAYFQFIQLQEGTFYRIVFAISIIVGLLLFIGGLILSHRIAGPLKRMQREFIRAAEEKPFHLEAIQFRKKDYFPELADSFNNLVNAWKKNS